MMFSDALQIVRVAAAKYARMLERKTETGPEGLEMLTQPEIDLIKKALRLTKKG